MSFLLVDSARVLNTIVLLSVLLLLLVMSPMRADECDMGAVSRNDFLVGLNSAALETIRSGSIGITECGTFIVAIEADDESGVEFNPCDTPEPSGANAASGIYVKRFEASGSQIDVNPVKLTMASDDIHGGDPTQFYYDPSLAVTRSGQVVVVFTGNAPFGRTLMDCECPGGSCSCIPATPGTHLVQATFAFDTTPGLVAMPGIAFDYRVNSDPSAGIMGDGSPMSAWANNNVPNFVCEFEEPCPPYVITGAPGWNFGPHHDDPRSILACGLCDGSPDVLCSFPFDPEPCISVRTDGYFAIAWADPEDPAESESHSNIMLRVYAVNGSVVDEELVNAPSNEPELSDQVSPVVSMDDWGNVIVTWVGVRSAGCSTPYTTPLTPIFARRFKFSPGGGLRDPNPALGEGIAGQFIVDNVGSGTTGPVSPQDANPTVALTLNEANAGRFFVGWNSWVPGEDRIVVLGQYFNKRGRPMGRNFVAHAATGPYSGVFDGTSANYRFLADSARHTAVYGDQDQVVLAYTHQHFSGHGDVSDEILAAFNTPGYWEYLDGVQGCCKGDLNNSGAGDGKVDGLDIQPFINLILSPPSQGATPCKGFPQFYYESLCKADMNDDAVLSVADIPSFIDRLMAGTGCEGSFAARGVLDCNENGHDDANDIAWGNSLDCNQNGVPDECDVNTGDPDGNELVSDDENANSVPDECEADCNTNGHPDDVDVASQTSSDMNSNGVPDECEADCNTNSVPDDWDISEATSADCNLSGVPDECEVANADCNSNGVPDDCDMNPEDPDGNNMVSADCNSNNYPDECDLTMSPPFGSIDCNENGIPDECDIASETSADANSNGIPDECEQEQQMMMGGPEGLGQEQSEAERWNAFLDWCTTADFAGMTQRERYEAIMNELDELNLPRAWPPVPTAP